MGFGCGSFKPRNNTTPQWNIPFVAHIVRIDDLVEAKARRQASRIEPGIFPALWVPPKKRPRGRGAVRTIAAQPVPPRNPWGLGTGLPTASMRSADAGR